MLENFAALILLQGAHYLLPLIIIPYLWVILGAELFGLVYGAQYLIQYFITLTDYGFQFSATRLISINRDDNEKVSEIFSTVMLVRFILLFFSLLILHLLIVFSAHFSVHAWIYLLTFGMVAGNVLFPVWFFQGMEKMKVVTIIQVISKVIFALGIFIYVKNGTDFYLVPVFQSAGNIIGGLLSLLVIRFSYPVRFVFPAVGSVINQLKSGWHLFVSTVATTIYVQGNGLMLSVLSTDEYVGYYAAGEKLIRAVASMFIPVSQALFPFLSRKFHIDRKEGLRYFNRVILWVGLVSGLVSLITFLAGPQIGSLILRKDYSSSAEVIRILSLVPFAGTIGSVFAYQLFSNVGWAKQLTWVLLSACVINIASNWMLDADLHHFGAAYSLLITEIYVPLMLIFIYLIKRKSLHESFQFGR